MLNNITFYVTNNLEKNDNIINDFVKSRFVVNIKHIPVHDIYHYGLIP